MRPKAPHSSRMSYPRLTGRNLRRERRRGFVPAVEQMELRALLAAFTVTTTADSGDDSNPTPGSLRQAILYANTQPNGVTTTITFDLALDDSNHVYYADNGTAGSVSSGDIVHTSVDDNQISDIDPDWPHSWWQIQPLSDLPVISSPVIIDGYSQPGAQKNDLANGDDAILRVVLDGTRDPVSLYCCPYTGFGLRPSTVDTAVSGLVIDNFGFAGILNFNPMVDNVLSGNFIGTDVSGTVAQPNTYGIVIQYSQGNQIGLDPNATADYSERNVISGNTQSGVAILSPGATNNTVAGNFIGVGRDGQSLSNGVAGVGLDNGAQNNTVGGTTAGAANVIADNAGAGVWVYDNGSTGNRVVGNAIYGNGGLGIDLGGGYDLYNHLPNPGPDGVTLNNSHAGQNGPNNWQNFPVLSEVLGGSATSVLGTLNSAPNATFTIDFYANPAPDPTGYGQGQSWLGSVNVTTDSTGNVSFDDSNLAATSPGEWISAAATDTGGDTSEFCQDVVVNAVTASNLQAALSSAQEGGGSGSVTLQTTSNSDVTTAVQSINGISNPNPSNPETVTLDLNGGTYTTDTQVDTQPGVTLVITNGTLVGGSPALVVNSGNVVLDGVTALNATAASTILVNGGSLIVRNSTIQESSVYAEAAISITGGTVDLGTVADPGGNTIIVNGAGELVHNTTSGTLPAVGDTFSFNGVALTSPWLSFTSLASTVNPSIFGQTVTFTATVRPNTPGFATPTGLITFVDTTTGATLGTASLSQGTASITTATLATGNHAVAAVYGGDPNYMFSSDNVMESVHQAVTMTAVTASSSTPIYGQAVTFTATVSALSPSGATPTGGTVTFYDGSTVLGYSLLSGGIASLTLSSLLAGLHTISAVYAGDGQNFTGSSSSTFATFAGNGSYGYSGDGGPATAAMIVPNGVAVDGAGDLFIADTSHNVVREVRPNGIITTVAGNGTQGYSGDGGPATAAKLSGPFGVSVDATGDLFIADNGNARIREVTSAGIITTVAGNGLRGFSGDGGPATAAKLETAVAVAVDGQGDLFIADSFNNRIREVTPAGIIITFAGSGPGGGPFFGSYSGDGGPATAATLDDPSGVAVDANSDLFIADTRNNCIREVTPNGIITTVAGGGNGLSSDGGPAINAILTFPTGVVVDGQGDLFIADTGSAATQHNRPVREVTPTGLFTTVATLPGYPTGVAVDAQGELFIADSGDNRVLRLRTKTLVTVVQDSTTTTVSSSASSSYFGQPLTFTATVTANAPGSGTPAGTVAFYLGPVNAADQIGTGTLSTSITGATTATFSTPSLPVGADTITATYGGDDNFLTSTGTLTVTIAPSLFVLNSTAKGALTVSGNASIKIPGAVVVGSSSSTAISASGNALITAPVIDVSGGLKQSDNATITPAPTTGVSVSDPLADLAGPDITGLTSYGSEKLTKGSQTIDPGIYSQITVSGNGSSLTLNPGTYIIEGGGLTVTGNASISGSGVTIYNAGSNYPSSGGNFGGITLSGNGTFNLSAPTSGTYAGLLIFQSRQNTRALSFSGNAMAGTVGTIYAANALLTMSGNAALQNPLVVGTLNLSGNVALTQTAAGSDGSGDTSGIANTLVAGDLSVYINDPDGLFTADELARIQDAINAWDTLLAPYNVTISEVSDPTLANMVIDIGTTSACGGVSNGVLGCFNAPNSEITMIQGWNWYAGADPTQIGVGQFDFQTTMTHELGHALGLGGATDPTSPMYETLTPGTIARTVTVADLNIPDPPVGADPQSAAPRQPIALPVAASSVPGANQGIAALDESLINWLPARTTVANRGTQTKESRAAFAGGKRPLIVLAPRGTPARPMLENRLIESTVGREGEVRSFLSIDL
jgi:CSLREA domain-containing protein